MVGGHTDGLAGIAQGILDDGSALFFAQNDPDGSVLAIQPHLRIQRGEIELHLADKFRCERANLQINGHEAFQVAMEEKQVDKVFLLVHLQPELAADKSKPSAHRTQEVLNAGDEGAFQFALAVLLAEFKKVKGVFVLHGELGLGAEFGCERTVEIRLAEQGFLVALIFDLVDEGSGSGFKNQK